MPIDLLDGPVGELSGGQLDGQRDPFEAPAQPYGSSHILGAHQRSAEQGRSCAEQFRPVGPGGQGCHLDDVLAGQAERLPAGRQHGQAGGSGEEPGHEGAATAPHVLTGVQDQQHVLVVEPPGEGFQGVGGGVVGETESMRHGGHQQLVVLERPQIDPDHGSAAAVPEPLHRLRRETALAHPAHAGEGDETLFRQGPGHGGRFFRAAHETARKFGGVDHHTTSVAGPELLIARRTALPQCDLRRPTPVVMRRLMPSPRRTAGRDPGSRPQSLTPSRDLSSAPLDPLLTNHLLSSHA